MKFLPFLFLVLSPYAFSDDGGSYHFQTTVVTQGHGGFNSPYSGALSMNSYEEIRTSVTATIFAGHSLWSGGSFFINPEIYGGSGMSFSHGVAAYPNGEIYRVDSPDPKASISRIFIQQVFGFGGEQENLEDEKNQIKGKADIRRLTALFGKFSLNDYFDNNTYAHDPRTQFLNWALMDNGSWDYAADTRGYTWGFYFEFNQPFWTARAAAVLEPDEANQTGMDFDLREANGENFELEWRYKLFDHPGGTRLLYYQNHAHMGNYRLALAQGTPPDVTDTRDYRVKTGAGLNLEQELSHYFGLFSRLGWSDGSDETWNFTEVEDTFSVGVNIKGGLWHREPDNVGVGFIIDGIEPDHTAYLTAGGTGFIIGDGFLTYAPEEVVEIYYLFKPFEQFGLTGDYQFVNHPAYNADRGPISILAARGHYEF